MKLYLLHGFLGNSNDWDPFNFHELSFIKEVVASNLFHQQSIISSYEKWTNSFIQQVRKKEEKSDKKPLLVGYSLGGRLLLHVLKQEPSLFSGAILISTNLGVMDPIEKKRRFEHDLQWKHLFQTMEWNSLISKWNDQKVFQPFKETFQRRERDYSRKSLANAFDSWSVGRQDYFGEEINTWDLPILWIVGEKDTKYLEASKKLYLKNAKSKTLVIKNCGHRAPWQDKNVFLENVQAFIKSIATSDSIF